MHNSNNPIIFETIGDDQESHQKTHFLIGRTDYTMIFTMASHYTASFSEQTEYWDLPNRSYGIKFAATERINEYEATKNSSNLYKNPNPAPFSYCEIKILYDILSKIILAHQKQFDAECYYFTAETKSLSKFYRSLLKTQHEKNLVELTFEIIHNDNFILKFPCQSEEESL